MTTSTVESLGTIFTDPAAYADPVRWHDSAARIRAERPILPVSVPGFPDFHAITRYADLMEVERHPDVFTNWPIPVIGPSESLQGVENTPVKTLIQMDGEEHRNHRGIVNDWFKPSNLRKLQGRIDQLACQAVDEMAARGGRCDFVSDVALRYPLRVILSILGLPEADYDRMLRLTQELFGAEDPDVSRMAEDETALNVLMDFVTYFSELAGERRARPTGDLASVIANAEIDGEALDDLTTMGHYVIIATAGHDTTSNSISGGLLALIEQPEQIELLVEEPELIHAAADELIRHTAPVKHFMRNCQETFELGGTTFEPGDLLLLSYASASRDEAEFPEPDRIDVTRPNAASHLSFGFGRHFCLGAHLARMEVRALFAELLARVESVELDGDPAWIRSGFVQGLKSLPIRYRMR